MKLRDANLNVNEKTLSHLANYGFCFHFLGINHDYFFRRGFESVQAQFLFGNINGTNVTSEAIAEGVLEKK